MALVTDFVDSNGGMQLQRRDWGSVVLGVNHMWFGSGHLGLVLGFH